MSNMFFAKQAWIVFALVAIYSVEHLAPYYCGRGKIWKHDLRNVAIGIINVGITTLVSYIPQVEFRFLRTF